MCGVSVICVCECGVCVFICCVWLVCCVCMYVPVCVGYMWYVGVSVLCVYVCVCLCGVYVICGCECDVCAFVWCMYVCGTCGVYISQMRVS